MLKMFLSLLMIINSLIMYFMSHPLSMGFFILMQSMLTCMLTGMMIKTYWFSYILFLTFLGGLMVLFIYVSSIASNELFNSNKMFYFFLIMMLMLILFTIIFKLKLLNFNFNSDMNKFNYYNMFNNNNEMKMSMNKLYNNNMSMLLMFLMIIYLFITLLAVVKITNIFYGPLRKSN